MTRMRRRYARIAAVSLLTALAGLLNPAPPNTAQRRAIDRAVDTVEPLLKTVGGYDRKLAPAVEHAFGYCGQLVEAIPGPLDINGHAFASDPLIHALFGSSDDIATMIGASEAVRGFMGTVGHALDKEFFALLGMRRYEKKVSGIALQDGYLRNDVPQKVLYFGDHTLSGVSPNDEAAREGLRAASFDSLVGSYAAKVKELRDRRQDLRTAIDVARARRQDKRELEERLRAANDALMPPQLLKDFVAWLGEPEPHLHLIPTSVRVDRMGVIVDPQRDAADANTLDFPELAGRDRRRWLVVLARLAREEALDAIAQREKAHRYIVI